LATFPLHQRHAQERSHSERKRRQREAIPAQIGPTYRELSEAIPRDLTVLQLISRDGDRCYLCKNTYPAGAYQVEHIIARKHGGTDHLTNLALACKTCNYRKGQNYVSFTIAERIPCFWL
jgi:5-methylcytosine-specific restriction endonuclease McrA